MVSDVDFDCCLFLKFSRTDISENLKSLAHGPVLLADLDGPRRIEAEQEDDQNENDRCEAHGFIRSAVKDHQGEKTEQNSDQRTRNGEPEGNVPVGGS